MGGKIFVTKPKNAIQAIDVIIAFAVNACASDIHIDPNRDDIKIRLRIDGIVECADTYGTSLHPEIISRLKILSGARTDIHFVPQDGRWRSTVIDRDCNFRISFMPTYHGENAVIRILSADRESLTISGLGFNSCHAKMISDANRLQNGLILVTGPTGSGKTTTLNACLGEKVKEPISVITLEDPVEYEIVGARQIHVRHDFGVTFASGLRSALRQDPDVIMVGEIRDSETAHIAVHTALTGHLVYSTLHTNSAVEAIPRLIDMGIDRYLLSSTLRLIVAQRLARRICQNCTMVGCELCRNSGYRGRIVIAELLGIGGEVRNALYSKDTNDLNETILRNGFVPMHRDGDDKVASGLTSTVEIMRLTDNYAYEENQKKGNDNVF
ncbi:MAG: GspE/PulE family protein [Patescibacteria group bacterium]|nr:GspE/PulE family protein [Patescibacteria group bacterium]